ncbi:hypothetical protein Tco_1184545 [Tanacetum coccineum]
MSKVRVFQQLNKEPQKTNILSPIKEEGVDVISHNPASKRGLGTFCERIEDAEIIRRNIRRNPLTGRCLLACLRSYTSGCQEVNREVDINKKTENRAKMTKLSMEWKRLCKIKAKVQKCQSQSQYRRISSQTGAGTEEYYWMQS